MSDIDLNEASARFAAAIVSDIYNSFVKKATRSLNATQPVINGNLKKYAITTTETFGTIRTIVCELPSRLLDIYQPAQFKVGEHNVDEQTFHKDIEANKRAVIRGHAGAGKSIFLKKYFLKRLKDRESIPIFFELRNLNHNYSTLFKHLYDHVHNIFPWIEVEIFRSLLSAGKIELYLDALDEVSHTIRSSVNTNVTQLIAEFPKAKIILTTRYGDKYATPASVTEYHIQPFSLNQATSLIYSLDFHEESKIRFCEALKSGLYEQNSGLLSNPLLCSIMLLTYRRFATIPDRLHLYYQQAYEVLFSRHDASKESGFRRDLLSGLDVAEMQAVLNHLAAVTYASEKFEFTETELTETLVGAINSVGVSSKPSEIRDDLIEAVSMIHPDGLHFKFVHRSFQEFFCANYISKSKSKIARLCIDAVKMRQDTDSVIPMVVALNPDRFEEAWLTPTLSEDLSRFESMMENKKFYAIVRETLPNIEVRGNYLLLSVGKDARSRNFDIYMSVLDTKSDFESIDYSRLNIISNYENLSAYFRACIIHTATPKEFKDQIQSGSIYIDTEDRNLAGLADLAVWEIAAVKIIATLRLWKAYLDKKTRQREASPLEAFERATLASMRRVEGDLGGRPRHVEGDGDPQDARK